MILLLSKIAPFINMCMYYYERRFYLIGDSAYALQSFLITPYDNAMHGTQEDDFIFSILLPEFA